MRQKKAVFIRSQVHDHGARGFCSLAFMVAREATGPSPGIAVSILRALVIFGELGLVRV